MFISYWHSDSSEHADRLFKSLRELLGAERQLFKDVNTLPYGQNFEEQISANIARSDAMLVVIVPDWLDARDPGDGSVRLSRPNDYVRFEIRSAF